MTILKPIFVPVKISWDTFGVDVGVLACPICDFEYTHQGGVEVFNREGEDIPCEGVMVDTRGELSRPQGQCLSDETAFAFIFNVKAATLKLLYASHSIKTTLSFGGKRCTERLRPKQESNECPKRSCWSAVGLPLR